MKTHLSYFCLVLASGLVSCGPNTYQYPTTGAFKSANMDTVQVKADEYDTYFERRYGLLFKTFANEPFSGRIITFENENGRDFVATDESYKDGKRNGSSIRWFSTGQQMYERNYREGKWHGLVTRWWPNGQKMYVRAYTDGQRHGKEMTWRSDGTQIDLAAPVAPLPPVVTPPTPVVIPEAETTVADDNGVDAPLPDLQVTPPSTDEPASGLGSESTEVTPTSVPDLGSADPDLPGLPDAPPPPPTPPVVDNLLPPLDPTPPPPPAPTNDA